MGKHESPSPWIALPVLRQDRDELRRKGDGSRPPALWRRGVAAPDRDQLTAQVDVLPAQARHLAPASASEQEEGEEPEPIAPPVAESLEHQRPLRVRRKRRRSLRPRLRQEVAP